MRDRQPIGERFAPLTESIFKRRLIPEAMGVAGYLLLRAGGKGACVCGTRALCETFDMHRHKATRILRYLERKRMIQRGRPRNGFCVIRLYFGPGAKTAPESKRHREGGQNGTRPRGQNSPEVLDKTPRVKDGISAIVDQEREAERQVRRFARLGGRDEEAAVAAHRKRVSA